MNGGHSASAGTAICPRSLGKIAAKLYLDKCTSPDICHPSPCARAGIVRGVRARRGGGLASERSPAQEEKLVRVPEPPHSGDKADTRPGSALPGAPSAPAGRRRDASPETSLKTLSQLAPSWALGTSWDGARGQPATPAGHVSGPSRPPRRSRLLTPRPHAEAQRGVGRTGCRGRRRDATAKAA